MPRSMELERRRNKKRRNDKGAVCRMWKEGCNCKEGIRIEKEKDLMSRM